MSVLGNVVVLGAATAGIAYFGDDIGGALQNMVGDDATGIKGLADQVTEALGSGFIYAGESANKLGEAAAGGLNLQADERMKALLSGAVAGLGVGAVSLLLGAMSGSGATPSPGGIPNQSPGTGQGL